MSRTVSVVLAAAVAFALVTVPTAHADDDSRTVRTDKGLVSGTVTSTYRTFGTIPFAAPPAGAIRPVKDFAKDHHCDFWGGRGA